MDKSQNEILVGIDVGSNGHQIAISAPGGDFIYEGYIQHQHSDFNSAIERLKGLAEVYQTGVVIGIEGYNGHIAPLDQMLARAGFEVLNVNPSRLYHFRRIFGAPYKNDVYDARLIVGYLRARHLLDSGVSDHKSLLPMKVGSDLHKRLKMWSRYLNELIKERTRLRNRLTKRLREYLPELLTLAKQADRKWLIILLAHCPRVSELRCLSVEQIKKFRGITGYGIGRKRAAEIQAIVMALKTVSPLEEEYAFILKNYALELLRLNELIDEILEKIKQLGQDSVYYQVLLAQDGIDTKLAGRMIGEILSITNFRSENAFAAYNGTCCLDHRSGDQENETATNVLCNKRLRTAMRDWAGCRIRCHAESKRYYDKKRAEGKSHNHALRCLSRQLSNRLFRILRQVETTANCAQLQRAVA